MANQRSELRCSANVVSYLGVQRPATLSEHRKLRETGDYMLVRDHETMSPFFWPWQPELIEVSS